MGEGGRRKDQELGPKGSSRTCRNPWPEPSITVILAWSPKLRAEPLVAGFKRCSRFRASWA